MKGHAPTAAINSRDQVCHTAGAMMVAERKNAASTIETA
jgi:hypothetical protein